MVDERKEWLQRIHAVLFHHGVPVAAGSLGRLEGERAAAQLAEHDLPAIAERQITVALGIIGHLNREIHALDLELERFARRQPGCVALMKLYGVGPCVSTAILAEIGDARRFSSSRQACAAPAWTSPFTSPTCAAAAGISPARAPRYCAGRRSKRRRAPRGRAPPTTTTTWP
jgi:hypothetical protein